MNLAYLRRAGWVLILLAVVWVVEGLNVVFGYGLNSWLGLVPRRLSGIDGILFMPVLHGSVAHAAANSGPLVILGTALALTATRPLVTVNAVIIGLGGLGVWIFGQTAIHVGASGLIFGWFGFLVARGLVDRQPIPLAVALGVGLIYGAMVWGVLPGQPGVSWEAHLFGALAGVAAAILIPAGKRRVKATQMGVDSTPQAPPCCRKIRVLWRVPCSTRRRTH